MIPCSSSNVPGLYFMKPKIVLILRMLIKYIMTSPMAMKSALSLSLPFEQRMMTAKMNDCFMAVHPHTIFAPLPLAKVTTLSGVIVAPKPRRFSNELDRYVVLSIAHWKRNSTFHLPNSIISLW